MGHDIYGHNKAGEAIAYIRFTMWDSCAYLFYNLLEATDCYAGPSGSGDSKTFSSQQMEKALKANSELFNNDSYKRPKDDFLVWQQKEIKKFITSCLETARKEGSVKVLFI